MHGAYGQLPIPVNQTMRKLVLTAAKPVSGRMAILVTSGESRSRGPRCKRANLYSNALTTHLTLVYLAVSS